MQEQLDKRRRAAERVTLIGSVLDLFLGVLKIVIGLIANSAALVTDGFHSLSDLLTDFMVILVLRLSHQPADRNHPWGHGRFETVATVALGLVLVVVGGLMAYNSLLTLFAEQRPPAPSWPALAAAAASIIGKEWIFQYSLRIGKALKSDLLIANAWHSRTDALSSVVVLVAVAGSMLGIWWLDALAAVLVALLVGKIGWDLVSRSLTELVDTALPEPRVQALRETILGVDGILEVHSFKSRRMGSQSLLEMHLQVEPHISAGEAHHIGDLAVAQLRRRFDDIGHVIFHIDTYDDQDYLENPLPPMPPRSEVLQTLEARLQPLLGEGNAYELTLYYFPDRIELELKLAPETHQKLPRQLSPRELEQRLNAELAPLEWFGGLRLWLPAAE